MVALGELAGVGALVSFQACFSWELLVAAFVVALEELPCVGVLVFVSGLIHFGIACRSLRGRT